MITREQALTYIMQNRLEAEKDFLHLAKELFSAHDGVIPPEIRAKFLNAGRQYGEFKLKQDWHGEMEQEIWDGVFYAGLARMQKELID